MATNGQRTVIQDTSLEKIAARQARLRAFAGGSAKKLEVEVSSPPEPEAPPPILREISDAEYALSLRRSGTSKDKLSDEVNVES